MNILSWNIQAAKGVDDFVSVERIAECIKQFCFADVICLQEILVTPQSDQVAELQHHFPGYTAVFGAAIDRQEGTGRLRFGNLVLTSKPILQIVHHKLPQPADAANRHMPRQAIEVIIDCGSQGSASPLRVVTTHLDYFSSMQRAEQVTYLSTHHYQCSSRAATPSPADGTGQFAALPETNASIYCGDFNFEVESEDYVRLLQSSEFSAEEHQANRLFDAWRLAHDDKPHDPTCGIFDRKQWQQGPHCRDFFFLSSPCVNALSDVKVQTTTDASDHQPIMISLDLSD